MRPKNGKKVVGFGHKTCEVGPCSNAAIVGSRFCLKHSTFLSRLPHLLQRIARSFANIMTPVLRSLFRVFSRLHPGRPLKGEAIGKTDRRVVLLQCGCGEQMAVGHPFTCDGVVCPRCSRCFHLPSNRNAVPADRAGGFPLLVSSSLTYLAKLDRNRFTNDQQVQQVLEEIDTQFRQLHARLISDTKATYVKGGSDIAFTYFTYYADPTVLCNALMDLQRIGRQYEA